MHACGIPSLWRRPALPAAVCLLLAAPVFAAAPEMDRYLASLKACNGVVSGWQTQAQIQVAMTIAVAIFGALITAFQGTTRGWAKATTACLGVCTVVFTGVTGKVFPADYRVLQQAALDGSDLTDQLSTIVERLTGEQSADKRAELQVQWGRTMTQFRGLEKEVLKGARDGRTDPAPKLAAFSLIPVAHAQSKAMRQEPAWVASPPRDSLNRYFVGTAEDSSLAAARLKSQTAAVKAATAQAGAERSGGDSVARYVEATSQVESSTFVFDPARSVYRFSTLLRVSKDALDLGGDLAKTPLPAMSLRSVSAAGASRIGSWHFVVFADDRPVYDFTLNKEQLNGAPVSVDAAGKPFQPIARGLKDAGALRVSGQKVGSSLVRVEGKVQLAGLGAKSGAIEVRAQSGVAGQPEFLFDFARK